MGSEAARPSRAITGYLPYVLAVVMAVVLAAFIGREGVTFGLAYGLDALRRTGVSPTAITLVGGGAASIGWAQLCADVFELPIQRPAVTEAAALGAALQARWVVDGVAAPATAAAAVWQPRLSEALQAARARVAELRQLAAEHTL